MNTKKLLALLLALVMILCALPVVYAAAGDSVIVEDTDISADLNDLPDVDVEEILYGDVDNSGRVDTGDVVYILQLLADWDVAINLEAANVDGDDRVTTGDVVYILQFLADWDVTLGPAA